MWGYNYVLEAPVYKWARPGFIINAVIFAIIAVPAYFAGYTEIGHAVSGALVVGDIIFALAGWYLYANGKLR